MAARNIMRAALLSSPFILSGCGLLTFPTDGKNKEPPRTSQRRTAGVESNEIVMYSMWLIDTGYKFGGKNPSTGLDCSGLVTHIYGKTTNLHLSGNAATLAGKGRPVSKEDMIPGDLVFFNTQRKSFSHVGIFVGGGKFIHAPHTNSQVRIDSLDAPYYAKKYEASRTFFD